MKVKELQDGLKKVAKGASPSATLPVLKNVLVESMHGRVRLVTTNLESFHTVDINFPGKGFGEWAVTVPVKILQRVVKALSKDAVVSLGTDGEKLHVSDDTGLNLVLEGIIAEEFPMPFEFESTVDATLDATELRRAVALTLPFVDGDEFSRPAMAALRLEVKAGVLKFVSADGFRLGIYRVEHVGLPDVKLNVSSKAVGSFIQQLDREAEGVFLRSDGKNFVELSHTGFSVVARCVEGRYPPYEQIIPRAHTVSVELPCKELADTLTHASVVAQDAAGLVTWTLTHQGLTLSAEATQIGEFQQTIPAEVCFAEDKMQSFETNFNYIYVLGLLRAIKKAKGPDTIIFEANSPTGPALFRLPNLPYMHVLMPMHKVR